MALPVNKRVPKILFILFVVAFCVYLVPRVAINFFYYPDDKIYGPDPWSAESVGQLELAVSYFEQLTGDVDRCWKSRNRTVCLLYTSDAADE